MNWGFGCFIFVFIRGVILRYFRGRDKGGSREFGSGLGELR